MEFDYLEDDQYEIDPISGELKQSFPQQNSIVQNSINRNLLYTKSEIDALLANFTPSSGQSSIPQLNADPSSPTAESAWVLKTTTGGAGGGKLKYMIGLGMAITTVGSATTTYRLSYRTKEGTTIRTNLT